VFSVRSDTNAALFGAITLAAGSNVSLGQVGNTITISATGGGGSLTFTSGLTELGGVVRNDFFTGKAGGQTLYGGTASGDDLAISSTAHATKGSIFVTDLNAGGYVTADVTTGALGVVASIPYSDISGVPSSIEDAFYVVTRPTDAPTNATDLGALATGILRQTVSGGFSTIATVSLGSNQVVCGDGAGSLFSGAGFTFDGADVVIGTAIPLHVRTIVNTGAGGIDISTTTALPILFNINSSTVGGYSSVGVPFFTTLGAPGGLVKATPGTGVLTIAAAGTDYQAPGSYITALTGDVTASGPGSAAATIANNAVTFAKIQTFADQRLLGNVSGGVAVPSALTAAQVSTFLNLAGTYQPIVSMTAGSVVFSGGGSTLSQDNANFFWDASSIRLGIGINTPQTTVHTKKTINAPQLIYVQNASTGGIVRAGYGMGTTDNTSGSYADLTITGTNFTTSGSIIAGSRVSRLTGGTGNFIFQLFQASGDYVFLSTTSDTERMRIANGGDVSIASLTAGGLVKATVTTGVLAIASGGVDYEVPLTFSNGVTRATNNVTNDLITGKAGSQTAVGGTAASETLTLSSTAHATKGKILFGTSGYDEVNNRLGIRTASPTYPLEVTDTLSGGSTARFDNTTSGGFIIVTKGATSIGGIGSSGAWLGSAATDVAFGAYTGKKMQFFTNNSVTASMEIATTGAVTMSSLATGLVKATSGVLSIGSAGSDYEVPLTFSTGLTRATNTITANLSTGVSGGQTVIGGTGASESLTYSSTSNGTKGSHVFGSTTGLTYNETTKQLSIGSSASQASYLGGRFHSTTESNILSVSSTSTGTNIEIGIYSSTDADPFAGGATYLGYEVLGTNYTTVGILTARSALLQLGGSGTASFIIGVAKSTGDIKFFTGTGFASSTVRQYIKNAGDVQFANMPSMSFSSGSPVAPTAPIVMEFAITPPNIASGASVTLDAYKWDATTVTFTGTTGITTATGVNFIDVERPTYTDGSALAITNAATVTIKGAPVAAGSLTITNPYALWVQQGNVRFDGILQSTQVNAGTVSGFGGGNVLTIQNNDASPVSSINLTSAGIDFTTSGAAGTYNFDSSTVFGVAADVTFKSQLSLNSITDWTPGGSIVITNSQNGATSGVSLVSDPNTIGTTLSVYANTDTVTVEKATTKLILFAVRSTNMQSMQGGMFIGTATAIPTGNPTGGFYMYVDGADNKLKVRGPSGTITTVGNP